MNVDSLNVNGMNVGSMNVDSLNCGDHVATTDCHPEQREGSGFLPAAGTLRAQARI
jgi:hypothetical protein